MNGQLILRFVEWSCGHHGQRPADIPVSSPEQAALILQAISHAISQPGAARAVLMDDEHAQLAYITDDHVSVGGAGKPQFDPEPWRWGTRPVVIHGTEAEIEEIHSEALADAVFSSLYGGIGRWDGRSAVWENSVLTSTLPREEIELLASSREWWYGQPPRASFELPPTFELASDVLAKLRAEAAALAEEVDS